MIGYPLDSHVTFNDGIPQYDRAITSAPLRKLIKSLFTDGVLLADQTKLRVQWVGDTRVSGTVEGDTETYNCVVSAGFGITDGCLKLLENWYGLHVDVAAAVNPRIDTVVLRLDDNDAVRVCDFFIHKGTAASTPVRPDLTRSGGIYEIGLADIYVPAVPSADNPPVVTDTRLDTTRCGIITSISEVDTTAIWQDFNDLYNAVETRSDETYQAWVEEYQNYYQVLRATQVAEFEALADELEGIIDAEAAGHLQLEIDECLEDIERNYFGIHASTTVFVDDNHITETIGSGYKRYTEFSADGNTITETIYTVDEHQTETLKYTKVTTFSSDGSTITETVYDAVGEVITD